MQKEKTNPELGQRVHKHLVSLGIETPITELVNVPSKEKIAKIEEFQRQSLLTLGLDLTDDSLIETPKRIAKMYVEELFYGLDYNNFPKCTEVDNKIEYDEMVIERCSVKSVCEHHLVYFGTAHRPDLSCWVSYMPGEKVLGLSKLSRIVDFFSRRPQIQERLTVQIAETIKFITGTEDVAVVMKGQHFCVLTRGVEDSDGVTITSSLSGSFRTDPTLRSEMMSLIKG
ncbi:GTP cyclohydrolase 1 [Xanthomonas phage X1]|nr:GTP cyclohydrolase 1 [Xanthomonas phage X1]